MKLFTDNTTVTMRTAEEQELREWELRLESQGAELKVTFPTDRWWTTEDQYKAMLYGCPSLEHYEAVNEITG